MVWRPHSNYLNYHQNKALGDLFVAHAPPDIAIMLSKRTPFLVCFNLAKFLSETSYRASETLRKSMVPSEQVS